MRFSVIIPTYNRANMLCRALRTVFSQDCRDFEVIVVDDGSTEDQSAVRKEFRDRVTFLRQENAGPGAARNRGASAAQGEYLAFLDSDDLWFPWTLAVFARLIEEHDSPTILSASLVEFSDDAELAGIRNESLQAESFTDYFASSQRGCFVGAGMAVLRRDAFLKSKGFCTEFINAEDHDLIMRMGTAPGFVQIRRPYTLAWRRHTGSATADRQRTFDGTRYLVQQERRNAYPGGVRRAHDRRMILSMSLRPAALDCLRNGLAHEAWALYREAFRWNLSLRRWRFLLGFPLMAMSQVARAPKSRSSSI